MEDWSVGYVFDFNYDTRPSQLERKYYAMLVEDVPPKDVKRFGRMTKEEALAMAKLLNATQPQF